MASEIEKKCSNALKKKKWNIAFAESVTAGRMACEFSLTEESGDILRGGIVSYDAFVKEHFLNVPHKIIEKYTPESAEVTQIMAHQTAKLFNSNITAAITGLASAGGSETEEKPVGTIFIHIVTPSDNIQHRHVFDGSPEEILIQVIDQTAALILAYIENL